MKLLSIDLDYIMEPSIGIYEDIGWDDHPSKRWKNYFSESDNTNLSINEKNLQYCFSIFLKAINNCDNIHFSYNHDSILDNITDCDDIDLINIDHHDDIIYPFHDIPKDDPNFNKLELKSLSFSYEEIKRNNQVHEGNWISLLSIQNRINSYTFIGNQESINFSKSKKSFIKSKIPKFQYFTRDQYVFDDYNFDQIFMCLSPQYIPPCHWHYFSLFLIAAEEITGKKIDYSDMPIRKFSNNYMYGEVLDIIC
jgi:hypothetical protein